MADTSTVQSKGQEEINSQFRYSEQVENRQSQEFGILQP